MRIQKNLTVVLPVAVLAVAFALAAGCAGIRLSQDYDPDTDFAAMQRYAWQTENDDPGGDPLADNPLLRERIRNAIEQTLDSKGFRRVPPAEADFRVRYAYQVRQRIDSENVRTGIGIGTGGSGTFGGIGISTGGGLQETTEATLVIDFLDAATGALLWRGLGQREPFGHSDPQKTIRAVNETVDKILAQFPPDTP